MKRSTLFLVLATAGLAVNSSFAGSFNGKLAGMGGAGIAGADFKNAATINPALLTHYGQEDDFAVNINAGALLSDQDDLIDNATDLSDLIDVIDGRTINAGTADTLIGYLEEMDGATAYVQAGANLQIVVPNQYASVAIFANARAEVGAGVDVSGNDISRIRNFVTTGEAFSDSQLESEVYALGAMVTEYGVSVAKAFEVKGHNIAVGVSPKMQKVETIEYITSVADFDEDDFDADRYTTDDTNFNMDLGVHYQVNSNWTVGATAKNLLKQDYATVSGRKITIEPQATAGVAYGNNWLTAEFDIDLNPVSDLTGLADTQFARVGVELNAFDWAQVRVGYVHDLKGTRDDVVTAGLGFSPFGVVNLDIAALYGENNTYGAVLQLGVNF